MAQFRRREKWMIYILAVLLCLVLASFWIMCNIYAKYTTSASGSDSARVAIFGHNQRIALSGESGMTGLKPGDSRTYTLTVANYNGQTISEVAVDYNLEIITTGNLPLEYQISKKENNSQSTNIGSYTETYENKSKILKTDDMYFEAEIAASAEYTIQVNWPEDKKNASYAGIPDDITVNINVQQVD